MRTVFAVAGSWPSPPRRFLTSRRAILSDVVDVIPAVCSLGPIAPLASVTRPLCFSGCHCVPPLVDLGRPGDGLAQGGMAALGDGDRA